MPLTPNNREEHWLQGMVDGETTLTPNKRREYWYKEIVDAIGSGGGGGGGTGIIVDVASDTPNLYASLTSVIQAFVSAGATSHLGVPFYYDQTVTDADVTSELSDLQTLFTDGYGKPAFIKLAGVLQPINYGDNGYVSFTMNSYALAYYYSVTIKITPTTGAKFEIYGWVSNIAE